MKLSKYSIKSLLLSLYMGGGSSFYFLSAIASDDPPFADFRYIATAVYVVFLLLFAMVAPGALTGLQISFLYFVLYAVLMLLLHGEYMAMAMWILWYIYVFLIFIRIIRLDIGVIENFMFFIAYTVAGVAAFVYVYAWSNGLELAWSDTSRYRFTGGLENPSIYSKLVATIFFLMFFLYVMRRDFIYLFFSILSIVLMIYVDVRTDLYAVFLGIGAYVLFSSPKRSFYVVSIGLISLLIFVCALFAVSEESLNVVLSGRLAFWEFVISESARTGHFFWIIFGTGFSVSDLHYHNQWLELFLRFGLIGLSLLLYPIILAFRLLRDAQFSATDSKTRAAFIWAQALMVSFGAMGMTAFLFPSLGNAYNIILMPLLFLIISLACKERIEKAMGYT